MAHDFTALQAAVSAAQARAEALGRYAQAVQEASAALDQLKAAKALPEHAVAIEESIKFLNDVNACEVAHASAPVADDTASPAPTPADQPAQ